MRQSYQHFSIALREPTDIPYFKYDTTPDHPCQMCSRPRDIGPTSGASWACRFRSPPGIRCTFFRACTRGTGEGGREGIIPAGTHEEVLLHLFSLISEWASAL